MKNIYRFLLLLIIFATSLHAYSAVTGISFTVKRPNCANESTGYIVFNSFTTAGPTGPTYNFRLNFPPPTPRLNGINPGDTIFNLPAGSYFIDVVDNGVYYRENITILDRNLLSTFLLPTDPSCFGVCDGSIQAFAFGGTGSYTFQWDDPSNQTTSIASNLCDGVYNVTVTDSLGCSFSDVDSVNQNPQVIPNVTVEDVLCNGESTGKAWVTPSGGTNNYVNFQWQANASAIDTATNYVSGSYSVTVTDSDGCTGVENFTINQPTALNISSSKIDATCFGEANGSISVNLSGGTTPYTYLWNDGASTEDRPTVGAGSYTLTVTDNNGCTTTTTQTLTEPTDLSIDSTVTDVSCNGGNDGQIALTVTGGAAGALTFNWTGGRTGNPITALSQGKYFVTVTNAAGCTKLDSAEVSEPTLLVVTETSNDPGCNGGSDGDIDISVSGGTPNYTFAWNDGPTTEDRNSLTAGTYRLTVTDANNCTQSISVTLNNPAPILPGVTTTPVFCRGDNTGTAIANPTGGSLNYVNYQWSSSGNNTAFEVGLSAGSYTVTVTDDEGCTGTQTFTVTEPATNVSASIPSKTDVSCFGTSTGSATAQGSGGTEANTYDFLWDDAGAQTTATAVNLPAGTYNVTVTDDNGCTDVANVVITEPAAISINLDSTDVTCSGGNDGSITATFSNGTPPYNYVWSNGTNGTGNNVVLNGLIIGTYRITVTDANNCTKVDSITVNQPSPLVVLSTFTDPLCNGDLNGTIDVTVTGGTLPYTYAWSDDGTITTEDRTNLGAGTYLVSVSDANNCLTIIPTTLTDPSLLTISIDSTSDVSCNGGNDGFLRAIASGGTGNLTYDWDNIPGTINGRSNPNLTLGSYNVTVTDNNGCTASTTSTINEPQALGITLNLTDASCAGVNDGSATASGNGGTSPYTYNWTGGLAGASVNGLAGGNYTVTLTDANGCTKDSSFTINSPTAIALVMSGTDLLCNGDNSGTASVSPSGGTPGYTYLWNDPAAQTSPTALNLSAGNWTVTVTDRNGCTAANSTTITEPAVLAGTTVNPVDPTCNGINNGTLTASPSGGTAPYTYLWSDPLSQIGITATGLASGTYTVTITDNNNCNTTAQGTVTAPPAVVIALDSITDVSCRNGSDGSINITMSGGNPAYTFNWDNGLAAIEDQTNLSAGVYNLTVTDQNGCLDTRSFIVRQPAQDLRVIVDSSRLLLLCNGDNDGFIALSPGGGTPGYSYAWDDGPTSQDRFNLLIGTYTVTLTDTNNCTTSQTFTISEPTPLSITTVSFTNPSCGGINDGAATIAGNGGTPNYTFNWSNGGSGTTQNNLIAGTYRITLTDNNGCTHLDSITLIEPNQLDVNIDSRTNVSCNGGNDGSLTVSGSGGTPNYTFTWSNTIVDIGLSSTISGLTAGTYIVTVEDANGCDSIRSIIVTEPAALGLNLNIQDEQCVATDDGQITANVNGGTPPYTYNWSNGAPDNPLNSPLAPGPYSVTITDNNGCTISNAGVVQPANPIILTAAGVDANCNNEASGSLAAVAIGGAGNFTFNWSDGGAGATRNGIPAGNYTVTATDDNGCTETASATVGEPDTLKPVVTLINSTCPGVNDGSITSTPTGGTAPYDFNWSTGLNETGQLTSTTANLFGGTYDLTITDANGCDTIVSGILISTGSFNITFTDSIRNDSCFGECDGFISIANVTGGLAPYNFTWSTGATNAGTGTTISNLCAGPYSVTITDANGCDSIQTYTITEPAQLATTSSSTPETCSPGNDGTATTNPSGGTLPYTYDWSNSAGNFNTIGTLVSATYTVTITDANGCSIIDNINVGTQGNLNVSVITTDVSCNGANDGTIDLTVVGATGTPSFNWDNGLPPNEDQAGLGQGTYNVTVSDGTGCTESRSITINEPAALSVLFATTPESCSPGRDGTISASASGGTIATDYTYAWNNGGTTASINNLVSGTYTVTITDDNNCTLVDSATVVLQTSFTLTDIVSNISCNGLSDGSIDLTVTGSLGVPTFAWDSGLPATEDQSNLGLGTYNVTVTDPISGCTEARSFNISQPSLLAVNFNIVDESCIPGNDGSVSANVSGGTAAIDYTYNWSNSNTTASINNLVGGTYTLTITDDNGCTLIDSATVNSVANFTLSSRVVDITCNGANDGIIDLTITGATGTPSFNWDNGLPATEDQTGLSQGNYSVTVTDPVTACFEIRNFTINEPSPISANFAVTDESCSPSGDGRIVVTANGGTITTDYTYAWSNSGTTDTLDNLIAGTYRVTITDDNNCTYIDSATVNGGGSATILLNEIITDASCSGTCDGNITLNPSGGTVPYTFLWDDNSNQFFLASLCSGTYAVTVTDAAGCTQLGNFTVNDISNIVANVIAIPDTCLQGVGSASANGAGGVAPYTYNWSNGQSGSSIAGIAANNYTVTVSDNNGCSVVENFSVTNEATFTINLAITDEICHYFNDGSISVSTTGGTNPLTYNWTGGLSGAFPTNVSAGTYTITVTDASGCTQTSQAIVNEPALPTVSIITTNETCFPGLDGTATATVTGGTPPYVYIWPNGFGPSNFTGGLSAGTYTLFIQDANSCNFDEEFTIGSTGAFTINTNVTDAGCNGATDGIIDLTISGGTIPLTFNWSNGLPPNEDQNNLGAGDYTVTITDATPCSEVLRIRVDEDNALEVRVETNDESCDVGNDGNAKVNVTGGTQPYTYNWSAGTVFNDSVADLAAGIYDVTVTDANGCSLIRGFPILSGSNIVSNEVVVDASCFNGTDGSITLNPSGSTNPNPIYSFLWFDGSTQPSKSNLSSGGYRVTISDNNVPPCTKTELILVNQPSNISAIFGTTPEGCNPGNDGTAFPTSTIGATPPYTYNWSAGTPVGNTVTGLRVGSYDVTVEDANGCTRVFPFDIDPAPNFTVNLTSTDATCNGGNDGTITTSVLGATNPLTYNWSGGVSGGATPTAVSAGTYTVTVTDFYGCTTTSTVSVGEAAAIISGLTTIDESCATGGDGSASVNPTNGITPYTVAWSTGASGLTVSNLSSGNYSVTITDGTPCALVETFTISTGQNISANETIDDATCNGSCDGNIRLSPSGGSGSNYRFAWDNGSSSGNLLSQCAGDYTVTITDAVGCSKIQTFTINEPDPIVSVLSTTEESCNPGRDATVSVTNTSGGTSPYTYDWPGGTQGNSATGLRAGNYFVTITDANGCTERQAFTINQTPTFVLTDVVQNVSCNGGNDGSIRLLVTGNQGILSYDWAVLTDIQNQSNLSVGAYSVTVTDQTTGCTVSRSFNITEPSPISATITTNSESCVPGFDGTISLLASGGTVAVNYRYDWDNGLPSQQIQTGLSAGIYNFTITDDNGCTYTDQATVGNAAPFTVNVNTQNVSCFGGNDGSIDLTVTGTLNPPTFLWSNSLGTSEDVTNLTAGNYSVTVTDTTNGCIETRSFTITEPNQISIRFNSNPESCSPGNDGNITAVPSGGTTPYTFNWSGGNTTPALVGITSGNYPITVTDANGCTFTDIGIVGSSAPFTVNSTFNNPSCNGFNDGTIDITVTGAAGALTYAWDNGLPAQEDQTNLNFGSYNVTITDQGNGCTETRNFNLIDPTAISVTFVTTDESCFPGRDGSAIATASGGNGPYSYDWSNSTSGASINNVVSGTYQVTVTDANSCTIVSPVSIGSQAPFTVTSILTNNLCGGDANGIIDLTVNGGGLNITFNWDNGLPSTEDQTGLLAGTYNVTVTDLSTSCTETHSYTITTPDPIQTSSTTTDANCGVCDGTARLINLRGGTGNINVTWLDNTKSPIGQTGPTANSLCASTYFAALEDANNCVDTITLQVNNNAGPTANIFFRNESCLNACDGEVWVTSPCITSGNCTVEWTDVNGTLITTNDTAFNVCPGTYFAAITETTTSCITNLQTIVRPGVEIIPNLTLVDDGCGTFAVCLGSAKTNPSGGIAPYTYAWSGPNGAIVGQDSIGSLCAGNYNLTITDASGCDTIVDFTINRGNSIVPNETVRDEFCPGRCDGEIALAPKGGQAPYSYTWSNGAGNVNTASNLCSGNYSVTVSDVLGCDTILNITITSPVFTYSINKTDLSCGGACDGTVKIDINGNSTGFNYVWSPNPPQGQGTDSISNLCDGRYRVTITSSRGCTAIDSVDVLPNTPIDPNEFSRNESCASACDGEIQLSPSGGAGAPYTFNWSPIPPNGQGVQNATNLCGGTYAVTISDAAGCDTSISFVIQSATSITASLSSFDQSCGGPSAVCDGSASIDINGGSQPYTYDWSTGTPIGVGDSIANVCVGTAYSVTVTDAVGCSIVETFDINAPASITASFAITNATCNICDGSIIATVTGAVPTFTYQWLDQGLNPIGSNSATLDNLCAGTYILDITDANGCNERFFTNVNDIGSETLTISGTDASCFNSCDGSATVNFICNDPACNIEWFDASTGSSIGVTTNTAANLCAGSYFVEVTNNSGCKSSLPIVIGEPSQFNINERITDLSCFNLCDGSINLNVNGATGPYTYVWSPGPASGQGTNTISSLCSGTYGVTITDASGCDTTLSFNVNMPTQIAATFTTIDATCGQADGIINASVSGGTVQFDYSYQWLDASNNPISGAINPSIASISAGTYFLRVTDDNSCQETFRVILNSSNGPSLILDTIVNVLCDNDLSGEISITTSGGNTPYTYNWLPFGQTSEDLTNIGKGTYTVVVTNSLGCITTDTFIVDGPNPISASFNTSNANCGQCDGQASVAVSGGTAPYTYLWSNGSTSTTSTGLCGGTHVLEVSDANGCKESFNFSINTTSGPTDANVSTTAASCNSNCDGSATVTPVGGVAPFSYLWLHNGATTNSLSNLCAGNYIVQVSDVSGCVRNVDVIISSPSLLQINEVVTANRCNANPCTGSIQLNVSGGVIPYTYDWGTDPLPNSGFVNSLCSKIYNVTVSDNNGCTVAKTINVPDEGVSVRAQPSASDVSCFGACDGSLNSGLNPSSDYNFQWIDIRGNAIGNLNTPIANNVCAGDYLLEITSLPSNCKTYYFTSVNEPDSINLGALIVNNISCAGACDGEVFVSTTGGSLLYTYSWNDPQSQNQVPASGLCAGTYSVTASDANGCSATTSATLTEPPALNIVINSSTSLSCSSDCNASADVSASGGVSPYTFVWSGGQIGPNPQDLCFGPNAVFVQDATGCVKIDTVFIGATDTVVTQVPTLPLVCEDDSIRLLGTTIGSSISSVGWYENNTSNLFTRTLDTTIVRPVGNYQFFLIASDGSCSDTTEYQFEVAANPSIGLVSNEQLFEDEVVQFKPSGQDPTYLYNWSPSTGLSDSTIAEPIASPRESITYILTVVDTNGCTFIDSVQLTYTPSIPIPSGISPNGDGVNDVWNIELLEIFPNAKVQVYSRWGELVYEQNNGYVIPWDGTFNGKPLPVGTYYYIIDLKSDRADPITGPITIVK